MLLVRCVSGACIVVYVLFGSGLRVANIQLQKFGGVRFQCRANSREELKLKSLPSDIW